ncbi:hypothetical protein RRF57_009546 [Xylaria bambusicola]|uniref:Uncharacterized protein n=1 Tax=Xylaria bambusicola TaxID=326684 RepID=A0AAN7Z919_9PEZI
MCWSHPGIVTYPDMSEYWAIRTLTISAKILRYNCSDSHGDAYEAVLVYTDPDDVEPGKPRFWCPPTATITTTAFSEPVHGYKPRLDRVQLAEELLLLVEIRRHEMTHQGKEGRDGEGFVSLTNDLKVYGMPIEVKREKGRRRINRYHEKDSNDAVVVSFQYYKSATIVGSVLFLFARFRIVERMLPHKIEAYDVGDDSRATSNDQS